MMKTLSLLPNQAGIDQAAALLRAGELVAFPTETVYGLGADAAQDMAVARVFAAKGRPSFNPLIVHVADLAMAEQIGVLPPLAQALAARFWPGPLTLVVPLRQGALVSPLVTADLPSVALRLPAHPVARDVLAAFGGAIAAPSANLSGQISPTRAAHVRAALRGRIAAVVQGGACAVGLESTILSLLGDQPRLLRPGGIAQEQIEALLGAPLAVGGGEPGALGAARPVAPGQLGSHYAPQAGVRLNATAGAAGEVMIGFGPVAGDFTLSESGDVIEAAARLFATLRAADRLAARRAAKGIAIAPIPAIGLGRAINDRLTRAAAPRTPLP